MAVTQSEALPARPCTKTTWMLVDSGRAAASADRAAAGGGVGRAGRRGRGGQGERGGGGHQEAGETAGRATTHGPS